MLVQASTLSLLPPSLSSKPLSLLFEPTSQSLALTRADSSTLLFSSLSPPPPLAIPPISSSSCFLLLSLNPNPNPNSSLPLFVSAAPSPSSASTFLRAWIRRSSSSLFAPVALGFKNRVGGSKGLVLDLKHGFGVRLEGSVNVLVMHSVAESRIWVLGARVIGDERVELVKCAVIECTLPIYEVRVSMGVLVLGEVDGVRVFPLRAMVKGGQGKKVKKWEVDGEDKSRCKLRTLKLRQDSSDLNSFFVMMTKSGEVHGFGSNKAPLKAVSIRALSLKKLVILDSVGDLYVLSLQNTAHSSIASIAGQINRLDVTMKVELLAIHPDMSSKLQVLWLSDGTHTVHVTSVGDMEHPLRETDEDGTSDKEMLISANQVIFTSEKVQDIVPLSANGILILGQESVFEYSID